MIFAVEDHLRSIRSSRRRSVSLSSSSILRFYEYCSISCRLYHNPKWPLSHRRMVDVFLFTTAMCIFSISQSPDGILEVQGIQKGLFWCTLSWTSDIDRWPNACSNRPFSSVKRLFRWSTKDQAGDKKAGCPVHGSSTASNTERNVQSSHFHLCRIAQ